MQLTIHYIVVKGGDGSTSVYFYESAQPELFEQ